jgi:P pilus assembly chaperone PapD
MSTKTETCSKFPRTALGLLAALLAAAPVHAQLGLGLAPMRLELKMTPGQAYSNTLKLSSGSAEKVRIRGEALDFQIDDKATPQFERSLPQEAPVSCKTWLTLNPSELEVDKEGFTMIRYTLRLPANVPEGSYACAAGFTTLPPAEALSEGMGMRMAVRIVAAFYIQVGAPAVQGALKEIKLEAVPAEKDSAAGWQAVVVLQNQGKMYFRPTGKLEVLEADGKPVETADFASLPVLRERDQRFLFPLKTRLAPGQYKLRARVDIGNSEVQQGTVDVSVDPPPAHADQAAAKF